MPQLVAHGFGHIGIVGDLDLVAVTVAVAPPGFGVVFHGHPGNEHRLAGGQLVYDHGNIDGVGGDVRIVHGGLEKNLFFLLVGDCVPRFILPHLRKGWGRSQLDQPQPPLIRDDPVCSMYSRNVPQYGRQGSVGIGQGADVIVCVLDLVNRAAVKGHSHEGSTAPDDVPHRPGPVQGRAVVYIGLVALQHGVVAFKGNQVAVQRAPVDPVGAGRHPFRIKSVLHKPVLYGHFGGAGKDVFCHDRKGQLSRHAVAHGEDTAGKEPPGNDRGRDLVVFLAVYDGDGFHGKLAV